MTHRERFRRALLGQGGLDRLPMVEWATYWDETLRRWEGEGMPRGLSNRGVMDYFHLDPLEQFWLRGRGPQTPNPAGHGLGIIKDEADYERILPTLYSDEYLFSMEQWAKDHKAAHEDGNEVLWFTFDGFFWYPRTLLGIEPHLYAFYDQPELLLRMNQDMADYEMKALEAVGSVLSPDFMTFGEDMSYNLGPMLSEKCFDAFLLPFYHQVIPQIKALDTVVLVDTDGDLTKMIPWLQRAGIQGALPLERQAGVDIPLLKEQYPDFILVGGYDKMVMNKGETAMRREFERLLPAMRAGGYLPSVDHQTPPGVSMEAYRVYLRLLDEYAHRAVQ